MSPGKVGKNKPSKSGSSQAKKPSAGQSLRVEVKSRLKEHGKGLTVSGIQDVLVLPDFLPTPRSLCSTYRGTSSKTLPAWDSLTFFFDDATTPSATYPPEQLHANDLETHEAGVPQSIFKFTLPIRCIEYTDAHSLQSFRTGRLLRTYLV